MMMIMINKGGDVHYASYGQGAGIIFAVNE
jgi:hypothetical protein